MSSSEPDARCAPPSDCWLAWERQVNRQVEAVARLAREEIYKLRAEVNRLRDGDAAQAVAAQWERMLRCYSSNEESVALAELLDALAAEIGRGDSGG